MSKPVKAPKIVKKGSYVTVEYIGKLEDGKVFDEGKIDFEVGVGGMIAGFDNGVIGMKECTSKDIRIKPKDGYGERDDNLTMEIPMKDFIRSNIKPVKGAMFTVDGQHGRIISVRDTAVTVDFNHFLAGKRLIFKVKVLSVS